jgi:hypothetical protein
MNILLFTFDLLLLPITLVRLILIYLYGSRYNIKNLGFMDVMMHAENKFFNQQEEYQTIDTINTDIRMKINQDSTINTTTKDEINQIDLIEKNIEEELEQKLNDDIDEQLTDDD